MTNLLLDAFVKLINLLCISTLILVITVQVILKEITYGELNGIMEHIYFIRSRLDAHCTYMWIMCVWQKLTFFISLSVEKKLQHYR